MSSDEPKKQKPITTSAESHFEPPEKIPDTLEVPPNTILLIPDHPSFINPPHFEKAVRERDWFTSFFYFCLPLTFGSQHGFIMKATYDFLIRWNGKADTDAIDIHLLEDAPDPRFVTVESHFGHGILTVQSRFSFRTPKGVNLMVKSPPNYYVDGISWLDAVVETDNLRRDFTFNLKVTRPNTDIYIRKGTPLGCIVPYPRYLLDSYTLQELKDPVELEKAQKTVKYFSIERGEYDFSKPRLRYMEGKDIYDFHFKEHQKTLDNGEWWQQLHGEASANGKTHEQDKSQTSSNEKPSLAMCPVESAKVAESSSRCPVSGMNSSHANLAELNKSLADNQISIFLKPQYDEKFAPVRANKNRPWMEEDLKTKNHAKFCLPLMTASGVGHFILSPAKFTVEWDGNETHDAVVTMEDPASHAEVTTHSVCGSITVQSKMTVRTKQAGDYVYIKGIANQIRQPFHVLEAMIEAWWAPATFGIVMVLNQACRFTIEKGQPIAQMFAVSREKADFDAKIVPGDPPRLTEWMNAEELRADTGKHFLYFKGTWPNGEPVTPHYAAWGVPDTSESRLALATYIAENTKNIEKRPGAYSQSNSNSESDKKGMSGGAMSGGIAAGGMSAMQTPKPVRPKSVQTENPDLLISAFRLRYFLKNGELKQAEGESTKLGDLLQKQESYVSGMDESLFSIHELLEKSNLQNADIKPLSPEMEEARTAEEEWKAAERRSAAKELIVRLKSDETRDLNAILDSGRDIDFDSVARLTDCAQRLESKNKHAEAETILLLAIQFLLEKNPSDSRLHHSLDFLTYILGRQAKLLDCLQWYFFIASSPQWKNDLYLASSSLNNLGFCFKPRKQNQEEAEMCFLGSWELIKTDPGKTDMQPRFLEDLAFFYRDWGKADTAEEIFRKLVEVRGTIACPKSDLARSLTDLSFVQDKMGKQKLAEENFARAISVLESDPNVDRRQLAQQIEYLAFFYKQHNRLSEAYPLFKRAASLRK